MPTSASLNAASAIRAHHAQLHAALRARVATLLDATRTGSSFSAPREAVVAFLDAEILPHARAEERTLYPAAGAGPAGLLVEAMRAEHRDLTARVDGLRNAADATTAVVGAGAILALFESHLDKENDRLIPALLVAPEVSLDELLAGMHELVG